MVFGHRNFWLLFRILKLIYFPTITNEETYVAGGGGANQPQAYTLLFGKYAWLTWFSMFSSYMYMQLKQYNYY